MTSHVGRLYALAAAVLGLFLAWAGVAAAPWQKEEAQITAAAPDQTGAVLARYERRLRRDARLVHRVVAERRAAERAARVPAVRIVTLPGPSAAAPAPAPAATTRTS